MPKPLTERQKQLAHRALEKKQHKPPLPLNQKEEDALAKFYAVRDDAIFQRMAGAYAKEEYAKKVGKHGTSLANQATQYGVPVGDLSVNLWAVCRWAHQFLADHGRKLTKTDDASKDDDHKKHWDAVAAEHRAKAAELDWQTKARHLVPRAVIDECLGLVAASYRRAGEVLRRRFGDEASAILNEALAEASKHTDAYLSDPDGDNDPT